MRVTYATPADEYIALHDQASDEWVLTHRAEYDAMAAEAFPAGWRPGVVGSTRERMDFLNRQCGIRAGFPSWDTWLAAHYPTPTTERVA